MTLDDGKTSALRRTYPDRRKYRRYETRIPAAVEITTPAGDKPFGTRDAVIRDISRGGIGLSLTVETKATAQEMSKIFLQRLTCQVSCHFPGRSAVSCLIGTVAWVTPQKGGEGMELKFGVNLEECDPSRLADLKAFLGMKESDS